jgi:hypothetical protein
VAVRGVLALASAFAVVLLVGFITTLHYDLALGRTREFSDRGVAAWLEYGFRSLLGPILYTTGLFVIVHLVGALWHFVRRLAPPVRRLSDHARTSISGTFGRITGTDGASVAQGLLLAQMLALMAVLWFYRGLIALLPHTVNDFDAVQLAMLDPGDSNGLLYTYTPVLSLLIAISGISWYALLRRSPLRATVPRASIAAAVAVSAVMVLLIALPDRLFYKSVAPEVLYQGHGCFVTGLSHDERLLYCPLGTITRTPIVKATELSSEKGASEPSIFAPPQPPAPKKRP